MAEPAKDDNGPGRDVLRIRPNVNDPGRREKNRGYGLVSKRVATASEIPWGPRILYMVLRCHIWKGKSSCYVSQLTLAQEMGTPQGGAAASKPTVRKSMRWLEDAGLVEVKRRYNRGRRLWNEYLVTDALATERHGLLPGFDPTEGNGSFPTEGNGSFPTEGNGSFPTEGNGSFPQCKEDELEEDKLEKDSSSTTAGAIVAGVARSLPAPEAAAASTECAPQDGKRGEAIKALVALGVSELHASKHASQCPALALEVAAFVRERRENPDGPRIRSITAFTIGAIKDPARYGFTRADGGRWTRPAPATSSTELVLERDSVARQKTIVDQRQKASEDEQRMTEEDDRKARWKRWWDELDSRRRDAILQKVRTKNPGLRDLAVDGVWVLNQCLLWSWPEFEAEGRIIAPNGAGRAISIQGDLRNKGENDDQVLPRIEPAAAQRGEHVGCQKTTPAGKLA
jgi:hypothetical protein